LKFINFLFIKNLTSIIARCIFFLSLEPNSALVLLLLLFFNFIYFHFYYFITYY